MSLFYRLLFMQSFAYVWNYRRIYFPASDIFPNRHFCAALCTICPVLLAVEKRLTYLDRIEQSLLAAGIMPSQVQIQSGSGSGEFNLPDSKSDPWHFAGYRSPSEMDPDQAFSAGGRNNAQPGTIQPGSFRLPDPGNWIFRIRNQIHDILPDT